MILTIVGVGAGTQMIGDTVLTRARCGIVLHAPVSVILVPGMSVVQDISMIVFILVSVYKLTIRRLFVQVHKKMKGQAVQLLVFLFLGLTIGALRQRRGTKISNIKNIESKGIPCKKSGDQFCHAAIVKQYGQNYANICNDGNINLMRIYP